MTYYRLMDGGWMRRDPWENTTIPVHVLNTHDDSPRWRHWDHYDSNCSWCWLGYTHSSAFHALELAR